MLAPASYGLSTGPAERCAPRLPAAHPLTPRLPHPGARGPSGPRLSISEDAEWAVWIDRAPTLAPRLTSVLQSVAPCQALPEPAPVPPRPRQYPAPPCS